jgi:hypothetical protein
MFYRRTEQWNRIESPKTVTCIYNKLIFSQEWEAQSMGKEVCSTNGAEKTGYPPTKFSKL